MIVGGGWDNQGVVNQSALIISTTTFLLATVKSSIETFASVCLPLGSLCDFDTIVSSRLVYSPVG